MSSASMVSYYQERNFNPVPIALDTPGAWDAHVAKRRNLYERHLAIPLALVRGRAVVEFGCNSGENALVLAALGANLTLVEPNEQVLPRLGELFSAYDLGDRIAALVHEEMGRFQSRDLYDLVIAEGFLCTLPERDEMLRKMGGLLAPGGLAVFSFNDRYGSLLENVRRMLLWRACELDGLDDVFGGSLELAKLFFWDDYQRLNASRPFDAWWGDGLLNPLFDTLWSYGEILPLVEEAECEFYSSSPVWASVNHFTWYKDVPETLQNHRRFLEQWTRALPFFLSGRPSVAREAQPPSGPVLESVADLVDRTVKYTCNYGLPFGELAYPDAMDGYLASSPDPALRALNAELRGLYAAAREGPLDRLLSCYRGAAVIRDLWGTPYHYFCMMKR